MVRHLHPVKHQAETLLALVTFYYHLMSRFWGRSIVWPHGTQDTLGPGPMFGFNCCFVPALFQR